MVCVRVAEAPVRPVYDADRLIGDLKGTGRDRRPESAWGRSAARKGYPPDPAGYRRRRREALPFQLRPGADSRPCRRAFIRGTPPRDSPASAQKKPQLAARPSASL